MTWGDTDIQTLQRQADRRRRWGRFGLYARRHPLRLPRRLPLQLGAHLDVQAVQRPLREGEQPVLVQRGPNPGAHAPSLPRHQLPDLHPEHHPRRAGRDSHHSPHRPSRRLRPGPSPSAVGRASGNRHLPRLSDPTDAAFHPDEPGDHQSRAPGIALVVDPGVSHHHHPNLGVVAHGVLQGDPHGPRRAGHGRRPQQDRCDQPAWSSP